MKTRFDQLARLFNQAVNGSNIKIASQSHTILTWEDLKKKFKEAGARVEQEWNKYVSNDKTTRDSSIGSFLDFYNKKGLEKLDNAAKEAEEKLLPTIKGILARFVQANKSANKSKGFVRPIEGGGKVRSGYGMREDPLDKGHMRMHSGADLPAKAGTPVLAPESGVIKEARPNNGTAGNMLVLAGSEGRAWTFMHLSSFNVAVGDKVEQGQVIAISGATGRKKDGTPSVTGAHLHLELRINGSKVDPMIYLPA